MCERTWHLKWFSLFCCVRHCHFVLPMVEWVCRWKPSWVLIEDTFKKKLTFKDCQLVKDGQNYDPVEEATQSIPVCC